MTVSRTRRSREEQRAQTRERLLTSAAEVIAARGLDGASIDEITERAGYSRGAFYSNFAGKPELLVELCEHRLRTYAERFVPLIQASPVGRRSRALASLMTDRDPGPDVLLLVELARLRTTNHEVQALLDRFVDGFVDLVDVVLAHNAPELGDPTPQQRRAGARGLVVALLGVAFVQHLGAADDRTTVQLLVEGVTRAAFPAAQIEGVAAELAGP
ncbi:MAG: TetR/AcrR family transcriptional regulator [Nitriliruptor sp.]